MHIWRHCVEQNGSMCDDKVAVKMAPFRCVTFYHYLVLNFVLGCNGDGYASGFLKLMV